MDDTNVGPLHVDLGIKLPDSFGELSERIAAMCILGLLGPDGFKPNAEFAHVDLNRWLHYDRPNRDNLVNPWPIRSDLGINLEYNNTLCEQDMPFLNMGFFNLRDRGYVQCNPSDFSRFVVTSEFIDAMRPFAS
jgi:hypothetical protein